MHGLGLCAWWKAVYEEVARRVLTQLPAPHSDGVGGGQVDGIGLRYLLPSYSPQEAEGMLGPSKRPLPTSLNWVYGPSFSTPIIGTSSSTMLSSDHSLATLIPSLPDDPKSRFLDQLVADSAPPDQSPRKSVMVERKGASKKERDEDEKMDAHFALSRVTPEDFWERMGFRQECSSGDVTGFFTLFVDSSTTETETETIHPTEIRSLSTDLKPAITERLLTGLLNVDFGNRSLALEGSAIWLKSVHAIVRDELGEEGWQGCMGEVRGKVGLQSEVRGEKRKDEVVTVLQPRKRKK